MDLQLKDAAKLLRVSEATLRRWIDKRNIPACRVSGKYRMNREALLEWATENGVRLTPDALGEGGPSDAASAPRISDALERGGVFHNVGGSDKQSVLQAVVERLQVPPGTDRAFVLQMILAREVMGSTGVGEGIAIPHPRNPIVLNMPAPIVSLCFLQTPIDFGAIDGRPVAILFTLLSPAVRLHLHLISRLAYLLHDPNLRACLEQRAGGPVIIGEMRRIEESLLQDPRQGRAP